MNSSSSKTSLFYTLFTQIRTLMVEINETDKKIHSQRHDLLYSPASSRIWASCITDYWPQGKKQEKKLKDGMRF